MTEPTGVNTNTYAHWLIHTCTRAHSFVHILTTRTHTLLQKVIIKWFCFLDLISPSHLASPITILHPHSDWQLGWLSAKHTDAHAHVRLPFAQYEVPPPLVCRNKQRPFAGEKDCGSSSSSLPGCLWPTAAS